MLLSCLPVLLATRGDLFLFRRHLPIPSNGCSTDRTEERPATTELVTVSREQQGGLRRSVL
jgi:hypothetical protein